MMGRLRNFVETSLGIVVRFGGVALLARRIRPFKVPILAYHSVSPSTEREQTCLALAGMTVGLAAFRRQMEYVAGRYRTITLEELARSNSGEERLPPNPCIVTFDDGFLDVYDNAVAVLRELKLKATFFIIGKTMTGPVFPWPHGLYDILDTFSLERCASAFRVAVPSLPAGVESDKSKLRAWLRDYYADYGPDSRSEALAAIRTQLSDGTERSAIEYINASQIRDLSAGGFEIGCHSTDHEVLSRLTPEEIGDDIRQSREIVSAIIDGQPRVFCYPFGGAGTWDERVVEILKENGFLCACTTESGLNDAGTDSFALRRIVVRTEMSFHSFVFHLSGLAGWLKALRRTGRANRQ